MTIRQLPNNPSFENLRKQAKSLLRAVKTAQADALERVGPYFGDPAAINLQYAQLVIAREYGFSSWTRLKRHVETGRRSDELTGEQLANRFLDLVCLAYGPVEDFGPARFVQAADLLQQHPEIRRENIYTASAIGDVAEVDRWLDREPDLINRKGGHFQWEPLMYAAYARLPGVSTMPAGLRLLERGADPNAHYMWGGQYKFTALTGVFGRGEGGPVNQPEHPDCAAFARAVLEAGADPNDSQAAYNRFFEPDDTCLELLIEFGLAAGDKNNWFEHKNGKMLPNPEETMHYQLIMAIRWGYFERAKLMIDNGVDIHKGDDTYDTMTKGRAPHEVALLVGQTRAAEYLRAKGARPAELLPLDRLHVALMAGDQAGVRSELDADPALLDQLEHRRSEMLDAAAKTNNWPALAAMIDVGFDISRRGERTPLHVAALQGHLELVQRLVGAGADTRLRDPDHNSPPIGWALHANRTDVVGFLDTADMDIFTAAARGRIEQLREQLSEDPARVNQRLAEVRTGPVDNHGTDWLTPLIVAATNNRPEAVQLLLNNGADATATDGGERSVLSVAKEQASADIVAMIERAIGP